MVVPAHVKSLMAAARSRPVSQGPPPEAAGGLVRKMPSWVARHAVLVDEAGERWLWCEPRVPVGEAVPSQVVLGVPPGRYLIDVFDAATGTCLSRESAEGGPIVAGLVGAKGPFLIRVRRV